MKKSATNLCVICAAELHLKEKTKATVHLNRKRRNDLSKVPSTLYRCLTCDSLFCSNHRYVHAQRFSNLSCPYHVRHVLVVDEQREVYIQTGNELIDPNPMAASSGICCAQCGQVVTQFDLLKVTYTEQDMPRGGPRSFVNPTTLCSISVVFQMLANAIPSSVIRRWLVENPKDSRHRNSVDSVCRTVHELITEAQLTGNAKIRIPDSLVRAFGIDQCSNKMMDTVAVMRHIFDWNKMNSNTSWNPTEDGCFSGATNLRDLFTGMYEGQSFLYVAMSPTAVKTQDFFNPARAFSPSGTRSWMALLLSCYEESVQPWQLLPRTSIASRESDACATRDQFPILYFMCRLRCTWPCVLLVLIHRHEISIRNPERSCASSTTPIVTKLNQHVSLPMETVFGDDGMYSMRGIAVHEGDHACDGHFHVLVRRGPNWFRCSDEQVSKVSEEEVSMAQVYMAMYTLLLPS